MEYVQEMKRPLIGITCGTTAHDRSVHNPQDRLNSTYSRAIALAGGIPVIVPKLDEPDAMTAFLDRLDGLLLSGGAVVDPVHFGEAILNETVEIDPPRDAAELPLIKAA